VVGQDDNPLSPGISNTRLLERAIRERWPIPEEKRKAIMDRQIEIAIDPKADAREATNAARTVIMADKINQQEEQGAGNEQHLHLHQHGEALTDEEREKRMAALVRRVKERLSADGLRGSQTTPAEHDAGGTAGT
jgi:hypothetical protein